MYCPQGAALKSAHDISPMSNGTHKAAGCEPPARLLGARGLEDHQTLDVTHTGQYRTTRNSSATTRWHFQHCRSNLSESNVSTHLVFRRNPQSKAASPTLQSSSSHGQVLSESTRLHTPRLRRNPQSKAASPTLQSNSQ